MKIETLEHFRNAINDYQLKYRSPELRLKPFEISEPYDLFPESPTLDPTLIPCGSSWPATWPLHNRAGVYGIFSDNWRLVYVGKASMNNVLGMRLSAYFGYANGRGSACHLNQTWKTQPRYVVTVAVPDDSKFEAPALEEFLITSLLPGLIENVRGMSKE